ncbi:MAG: transglutaminase [Candidatus Zixiibacteriota bacterium]|nr:MAG: transglutaminase [candidate division Zixibacteria bacterium]
MSMKRLTRWTLVLGWLVSAAAAGAVTGDVVRGFPAPGTCSTGMAWDGKHLWVADLKTDTIYAVDPASGTVARRIPSPTYRAVGLAWDGSHLWVVCGEEEKILRLDPEDGTVTATLESPAGKPTGLAWDGQYLWLACKAGNQLHQVSPLDGTTIRSFRAPAKSSQGLAWDGRYLWVADRVSDRIYMVSPKTGDVILIFDAPAPYADGLAWDGKHLWNVDFQSDSLYCLAVNDGAPYARKSPRTQAVEFTSELRNYGPGTVKSADFYLAIPTDLPNQELLGEPQFYPAPTAILTDQWGQKVAHFRLENQPAGSILKVAMTAEARLWDTRWFIFPEKVGKLEEIPGEIREKYLVDDEKFDLNHPAIQKAVKEAVGEEKNPYWMMRKIFRHINDRMEYELSGGWNTAPTVLQRGTGSCSEYTFVFLAVCRAAGLPARYAGSITVRGDDASLDDVFHRWAEVYLPGYGWVPVDPSGGDSPSPEDQAQFVGHLANRYLITTVGGGNSQYLSWNYNGETRWTTRGECKLYTEHMGEWRPLVLAPETEHAQVDPPEGQGNGAVFEP